MDQSPCFLHLWVVLMHLYRIGESYAQACQLPLEPVFEVYEHLAKLYVKGKYLKQAQEELANYKTLTQTTLDSVNKRFSGNIKARTLTLGGELAMSTLMDYILKSHDVRLNMHCLWTTGQSSPTTTLKMHCQTLS